ncbi:MAG: hypothetical protein HQK89_12780 [Nitrospirae bacterium]|nr:hypothetical protein [Nitrospirota bacterium]
MYKTMDDATYKAMDTAMADKAAGHKISTAGLPAHCLDWLVSSRLNFINDMKSGKPLRYFSAHLPVMATWPNCSHDQNQATSHDTNHGAGHNTSAGQSAPEFPVNMTVKGIGLIPKRGQLQYYTDLFETVTASSRTLPPGDSISQRVDAMAGLYLNPANFDATVMGGLEIFGGKTLGNIYRNARTSLLYVGMEHCRGSMKYVSFQVNGEITIIEKDDPYYRYLLASRKLFEYDRFHLYQPDYPYGYLIGVREVMDKSPWSRQFKTNE